MKLSRRLLSGCLCAFLLAAAQAAAVDCPPDTLLQTLPHPNPAVDDNFATAVSAAGDLTAFGVPGYNQILTANVGRVYLVNSASGDMIRIINNPAAAAGDEFGTAVAIHGALVVVGTPGDNPGGVNDAGTAYVFNAISGVLVSTLNNPTPATGEAFGSAVAIFEDKVLVGSPHETSGGATMAGAVYVFNALTGAHVATWNNPAPGNFDFFGYSVGLAGGYGVVGTPGDTVGAVTIAGAVYVFNASTNALANTFSVPSPANADSFGSAVAISGNLVVASAPYRNVSGVSDAGAAYVFTAGGGGGLLSTFNNPTPVANEQLGLTRGSVAINGGRAMAATMTDSTGGLGAGAAYIFNASTAALESTLVNPTPAIGDRFGHAVALWGNRAVVGANNDTANAKAGAGAAFSFDCVDCVPIAPPAITLVNPTTPTYQDGMGAAVAIDGAHAAVGIPGDDPLDDPPFPFPIPEAGSAYIFNAGSGSPSALLENPSPEGADSFGGSIAIADGVVVVGATGHNQASPFLDNVGEAYLFSVGGSLLATLANPSPHANDIFGHSVGVSYSSTEGGYLAVVGAHQDDTGASNAGVAYVFNASGGVVATLNNPTPATNELFGRSVAISGDLAVVGASSVQVGSAIGAGEAYVFNATTGALVSTLKNPSPSNSDAFGMSVAISGNLVVVAATADDYNTNDNAGRCFVFEASTGKLLVILNPPSPMPADTFGKSVSISGDLAIVGAYSDSPPPQDTNVEQGTAYIFHVPYGTLQSIINNPTPANSDFFANSVSISNGVALIGCANDHPAGGSHLQGSAYVYEDGCE